MGVRKHRVYAWKAESGVLAVREAQRLRQLEDENRQLKNLVAARAVETEWKACESQSGLAGVPGSGLAMER